MAASKEVESALSKPATLAAGRFTPDGKLVEYQAKGDDVSPELAAIAAQFAATVSMLLGTFAASYSVLSEIPLVPFHGWRYSGGDMTSFVSHDVFSIEDSKRAIGTAQERTLRELMSLPGVKLAAYYSPDGSIIAHEQSMPLSAELRGTATEIIGSVVGATKGLAMAFARLSRQEWTPFRSLLFSGGDWTVGASGTRWVLADAGECSLDEIHKALPW